MKDTNFWKKYFTVYDTLNYLIPYRELLQVVTERLDPKANEQILDAGCGTGNLAQILKKNGVKVTELDSCKEGLEICLYKDKSAKIVHVDIKQRLRFPDNHFDK